MLSPKIEYQSQEESVVTIQIEDTLVSCSAIGTDGADSLLTRDPVSAVSYVLLMYCKAYPLHVFGYTTDGLLHQCNLLMCNWRWHVAIPLYPTDNADSASGFQKGRTLATRLPKQHDTAVLLQHITMIEPTSNATYCGDPCSFRSVHTHTRSQSTP